MSTAITWLISFFLVIGTAFTAVTTVISNSSARTEANADSHARLIDDFESSFKLVSVKQKDKHKRIELVVTNDGRQAISDWEDWVITVRYDQDGAADEIYVAPPYTDTLVDNTWTTDSFWLEYSSQAELIEPGILNVHEEVEIRIKLNPKMEKDTYVVVTLTSPFGVSKSITFEA